jgi:hypothetical protein
MFLIFCPGLLPSFQKVLEIVNEVRFLQMLRSNPREKSIANHVLEICVRSSPPMCLRISCVRYACCVLHTREIFFASQLPPFPRASLLLSYIGIQGQHHCLLLSTSAVNSEREFLVCFNSSNVEDLIKSHASVATRTRFPNTRTWKVRGPTPPDSRCFE